MQTNTLRKCFILTFQKEDNSYKDESIEVLDRVCTVPADPSTWSQDRVRVVLRAISSYHFFL